MPQERNNLQLQRSAYADAFLGRCLPVDPNDFNLPHGTYICPWMPEEPREEKYYNCGNCGFGEVVPKVIECRICGETFHDGEDSYGAMKHSVNCRKQLISSRAREKLESSNLLEGSELLDEAEKETWKQTEDHGDQDEKGVKDMEYWASRCYTKSLPLFDSEVMRRPDINCPWAVKERHGHRKLDFGSHCYQASLLPSDPNTFSGYAPCAIQTTWAPLDDFLNPGYTSWSEDPRYRLGINYTKDAVWAYNQRQTWRDDAMVFRPFTPHLSVPRGGVNFSIIQANTTFSHHQHGGPDADVWTTENQQLGRRIKPLLEEVATLTNDCPIPRYQMIIDPNQFVRTRLSDGKKVWVPCEFDVASDGSKATLVGNDRAHWINSKKIDSIATPVLSAALPLLAKLTKPHLLLEGQRLQVVVKAQSITVPKKQNDDETPEYIGLWHVDGEHEPVVAVVLYYYDVDDALVGGNMEFLDRRPMAVLGYGDTEMPRDFPPGHVRQALRPNASEEGTQVEPPMIPNCSVSIKTGTMLVFSNYQMAHRVLRMVNTSQLHPASRKFVALFVLDPAAKRLVPARCHLAHAYLYKRALTGECSAFPSDAPQDHFPEAAAELVMEYLGIVPSIEQRRLTRNEMLRSQLIPKHYFGASNSMVCSTGNGCLTMIGWIDSLLADGERDRRRNEPWGNGNDYFEKPAARINALNFPPTEVGRGLSETLSIPSEDLDFASFIDTLDERNEKLNADMK